MRQRIAELEASESKRKQVERTLQVCHRFFEIVNQHTEMAPLLKEITTEIKEFIGCPAVELCLLDAGNSIPHQVYEGLNNQGDPFYTNGVTVTYFPANASEEEIYNQEEYESMALIPIYLGDQILGSIHIAGPRGSMIPLEKVEVLEEIGKQLGIVIQRVHAEEASRDSKEVTEAVLDNISDSISIIDTASYRILWANKAFLNTLKMEAKDVIGKHCHEVNHSESTHDDTCPLDETLRTGSVSSVEHIHYDRNAGEVYVEVSTSPIKNEKGEIHRVIHIARNITERKLAAEALKKANDELERRVKQRTHELSESNALLQQEIAEHKRTEEVLWDTNELLETIFFTTHFMIAYIDRDFNFIRVNRAYAAANGHAPEFFVGQSYFDLYPDKHAESIFRNVVDKGEPYFTYAKPFEFAEDKGPPRYWDWSLHPVKGSYDNVIKGIIMLFLDVTGHKRMEEQLQWSQKMESLGRLAAGVAHEIGNPLNSISSLAQLLQMKSKDASAKENLQLMREHIVRISKIVRNMIDFAHPVGTENKSTQVNDVLNAALEISKYDKRARSIDLITELASNMQPVFLVEDQLLQVFTNIIFNAFDAMQNGGRLTINTSQESDKVHISFTDTGTGIREDVASDIFDPFFTTKDIGQGTGLGLSISYGIVKSFGGEIAVQSTDNLGSTFTVILPIKHIAERENG